MDLNVHERLDVIGKIQRIDPANRMLLQSLVFVMKWVEETGSPLSWESIDAFIAEHGGSKSMALEWVREQAAKDAKKAERDRKRLEKASRPPCADQIRIMRRLHDEGWSAAKIGLGTGNTEETVLKYLEPSQA